MSHIPEAPVTEPSFANAAEADSAKASFMANNSVPEARSLIALGYGPFGASDPNFNPVHRRRYYLTKEKLLKQFEFIVNNSDRFFDEDVKYAYDEFMLDVHWFLKSRDNIITGSVPWAERRTAKSKTVRRS